jgi:hypothetical protein
VEELLAAPGMGGLLGVLDPPARPVIRELKRRGDALLCFAEAAWRVNRAASKLHLQAEALLARAKECWPRSQAVGNGSASARTLEQGER